MLTTTVTGSSTTRTSATARFCASISVRRSSPNALASASISRTTVRLSAAGLARISPSLRAFGAQVLQLLLDLDRLEARELAQANVEDVVGLPLAQAKARDQRRLRLVGGADDRDHLVDVEQHELPAFEDVDALLDLAEAMPRAPLDRRGAKARPLAEQLAQALLRRPAVGADHRQVDRRRALEARVREQRVDELGLRHGARLRLEDDPHRRFLARLVADRVEHREHRRLQLQLLRLQAPSCRRAPSGWSVPRSPRAPSARSSPAAAR
jgi:hypothetical protein